jgi:WD40 repeat protein
VEETNPLYFNGKKRRLLSTGLNGTVIEWDLLEAQIRFKYSVQAAIWHSKMDGKFLYLACEDGSIKVVKAKKRAIELTKTYPRAETRCLCLAICG